MAAVVGDKVIYRFVENELDTHINCRQQGCLPMIGTVAGAPGGGDLRVVWPTGEDFTVPEASFLKVFEVEDFGDDAALSFRTDIGKYVQITQYPFAGIGEFVESLFPGTVIPPSSPAASGIVVLVLALANPSQDDPDFIASWIAVQNGKKHLVLIGAAEAIGTTPAFTKAYVEQPGRRAVGFG